MDLQNQNGSAVKNGTANETKKALTNGEAKKAAINADHKDNSKAETPAVKQEFTKPALTLTPQPGKVEQQLEQPKAAEVQITEPVLTLEAKLKAVDNLHRISVQRLNLISRIKQLEIFEVALMQENDELEENPYQGCKLIIEDDKRRQFTTTTPGLIRLVSQFIFNACEVKLLELEAKN